MVENVEALLGSVEQLEQEGRYERALLLLECFPSELRQREDICLFRAYLRQQLLRWDEALETLQGLGEQEAAKDLRRQCIESSVAFLEGLGQLERAATVREGLVRQSPHDVAGLINQGVAFAMAEKYDQAIQYFDQAIQLEQNNDMAWYNKGVACFDSGNLRAAFNCFEQTIALNRSHAGAWYHRALCLLHEAENISIPWTRNAKLQEARQCLGKALRINPQMTEARECLQRLQG